MRLMEGLCGAPCDQAPTPPSSFSRILGIWIPNNAFLIWQPVIIRTSGRHYSRTGRKAKKLWAVAMTHLPRETILPLKVRPDTLLGYKAAQVHGLLKDNGIETGDVDCKQGCLVYGAAALDTELADQFWDIGFQDVDDTDDQGLTALIKLRYSTDHSRTTPFGHLEMASWLIDKGTDTALCPIIYDFLALHLLGATLGWSIAEWAESSSQLTSSYEAVHWCVRMHEVLSKKKPLSEEEKNENREIGLIFEPESEE
ncbi:hypothetical protein PENSUB_7320 [Penicillium subrubescens]|uniref:Uncharacterized protein n=1 Tax=Penicillium subrubescens TaxID=1316194 RepID=A0A1Q5TM68_9EURO|nr:hypothetical protein PENSUB_7320 [Penicillium subrubescens]